MVGLCGEDVVGTERNFGDALPMTLTRVVAVRVADIDRVGIVELGRH